MFEEEGKLSFNNQLDVFIKEIQEVFHLNYEKAIKMIIDGILNSPHFQEEFYILKNEIWDEESVWIGSMKIVRRKAH